jgi:hypothetical protein
LGKFEKNYRRGRRRRIETLEVEAMKCRTNKHRERLEKQKKHGGSEEIGDRMRRRRRITVRWI